MIASLQLLLSGAALGASPAEAPAQPKPAPAAAEILGRISKSHPRLLATNEDFNRLRESVKSDTQLKSWTASLRKSADKMLEEPASIYEIPDGLRLLSTSRRVVSRVYTLALLHRLEGNRKYAERAWKELDAAAHFPDWNPRHFLDTAEMTHAFAIGYDWLYEVWTADQRKALQTAMVELGLKPALKVYTANNSWARARHNWNQVCNGGIGMGALALAEVEPDLCGQILQDAIKSLPLAMVEFGPDGAWQEGPGYWAYATAYNVVFLAGLKSAVGTDFGLSDIPGFSDTGLFPLYVTGPTQRTFNYADGGDRAIRAPQLFWLARRFNQPVLAWYQRQLTDPTPLDLLWHTAEGRGPRASGWPLDKYFRAADVITMRSQWEDPQAVYVAFKGGDNKANHSHLDLGTFVFDALGVRWAVDLGADNYNLPNFFGKDRWNYYRLRAEGQNTLVVNPGEGPDQDPKAAAPILRFNSKPDRAFGVTDLTAAYKKDATKVWRGVALENRQELLIQDEIETKKPAEIYWFMHTPADIRIESDGQHAVLEHSGKKVYAKLVSPEGARFEVLPAQPLATSPKPEGQAKNENIRKLTVHLTGATKARLAIRLATKERGDKETTVRNLSDW
jgi:hypothetical protein